MSCNSATDFSCNSCTFQDLARLANAAARTARVPSHSSSACVSRPLLLDNDCVHGGLGPAGPASGALQLLPLESLEPDRLGPCDGRPCWHHHLQTSLDAPRTRRFRLLDGARDDWQMLMLVHLGKWNMQMAAFRASSYREQPAGSDVYVIFAACSINQ